jgi:hypothetical protein
MVIQARAIAERQSTRRGRAASLRCPLYARAKTTVARSRRSSQAAVDPCVACCRARPGRSRARDPGAPMQPGRSPAEQARERFSSASACAGPSSSRRRPRASPAERDRRGSEPPDAFGVAAASAAASAAGSMQSETIRSGRSASMSSRVERSGVGCRRDSRSPQALASHERITPRAILDTSPAVRLGRSVVAARPPTPGRRAVPDHVGCLLPGWSLRRSVWARR